MGHVSRLLSIHIDFKLCELGIEMKIPWSIAADYKVYTAENHIALKTSVFKVKWGMNLSG